MGIKEVYATIDEAVGGVLGQALRAHEVESRNGPNRELFMNQITIANTLDRYQINPEREASLPAQIAETAWVLAGRNDIEWLSAYLPQAPNFSDDGTTWKAGYGPRLRGTDPESDQLDRVIDLLQTDPDTRRAVIGIYDPDEDEFDAKDFPCTQTLHFIRRQGKLFLHVTMRSNDIMWGFSGINFFEWSTLLEIVSYHTGIEPGSVTFSTTSLHLYERHYKKAKRVVESSFTVRPPVLGRSDEPRYAPPAGTGLDDALDGFFDIEKDIRDPQIDGSKVLGYIGEFPEPMFKSWLMILFVWWRMPASVEEFAENEPDSMAMRALSVSPKCKTPITLEETTPQKTHRIDIPKSGWQFIDEVSQLHEEKNKAYGDSWRRRGEMIGIAANIARKVDRLGYDGGGDTSTDTAVDLLVYLIKYGVWLRNPDDRGSADDPRTILGALASAFDRVLDSYRFGESQDFLEQDLRSKFEDLERVLEDQGSTEQKKAIVQEMTESAIALAYRLWTEDQKDTWKANNETRFFNGYNED